MASLESPVKGLKRFTNKINSHYNVISIVNSSQRLARRGIRIVISGIRIVSMSIEDKIKQSLNKIRPALQADGGDLQFVAWDEKNGVVQVQLMGMCAGCPMAQVTLKEGVEAQLKKDVPEVKSVENV